MMGNRTTVMVVEDDFLIRMVAVEALSEAGFDVTEAEDAQAALDVLQDQASDVQAIVTDMNMPGPVDGLKLVQRASVAWPWIKLILATGRGDLAAGRLPKGCRFLAKPYDIDSLVHAVEALTVKA